jgi:hypothetical protein
VEAAREVAMRGVVDERVGGGWVLVAEIAAAEDKRIPACAIRLSACSRLTGTRWSSVFGEHAVDFGPAMWAWSRPLLARRITQVRAPWADSVSARVAQPIGWRSLDYAEVL